MTYAFSPGRPFTEDFRAVGAEQVARAVAVLKDQPAGVHEAIHDARKNFKRLRSLYRLVACDAPLFQKQENARIRDVARNLSTVRDAAALVENASYLREHAADHRHLRTGARGTYACFLRRRQTRIRRPTGKRLAANLEPRRARQGRLRNEHRGRALARAAQARPGL
ncbi:hypothetical protein SF83666_c31080 [Sinorhizobium fredii CCBAU 83666]|nr:hypothetical protein SF83666_c31080 [Sinorhizobium fredii CCBAU 83666]